MNEITTFDDLKRAIDGTEIEQATLLLQSYTRRFGRHPQWPALEQSVAARSSVYGPASPLQQLESPVGNQRMLWLTIREGLIIVLGGIERYLGMTQSIIPKRKRERTQQP